MSSEIVYKCPGNHRGPKGTTYSFKGVSTQEEADSLLSNGWSISLNDAIDLKLGVKPVVKTEINVDKLEDIEKIPRLIPDVKPKPKAKPKKAE